MSSTLPTFESILLSFPSQGVLRIDMNNPRRHNAMAEEFWYDLPKAFEFVNSSSEVAVVILGGGEAKNYTSGIDVNFLTELQETLQVENDEDGSRTRMRARDVILTLQNTFNAIEGCRVPVICEIFAGCIGGGVDMITAADMRYASKDAYFVVKEVDIGLAPDVGTLQRIGKLGMPEGIVNEMCYTGMTITADEACQYGLVNKVLDSKEDLKAHVLAVAENIAAKSPIVTVGIKDNLKFSKEHDTKTSLRYMALWNAGLLSQTDVAESIYSRMEKRKPLYAKL